MKAIDPDLAGITATLSGEGKTPVSLFRDPQLPAGTLIVVSRWKPSLDEQTLLAAGGDIYVAQLSDNDNVQTLSVFIDPTPFKVVAPIADESAMPETVPTDSEGVE